MLQKITIYFADIYIILYCSYKNSNIRTIHLNTYCRRSVAFKNTVLLWLLTGVKGASSCFELTHYSETNAKHPIHNFSVLIATHGSQVIEWYFNWKTNKQTRNTSSVTIQTIHNDQTLPKNTCNGKGEGIKLANYRRRNKMMLQLRVFCYLEHFLS